MANTVSDFLLDRLEQWGVRTIFGFPGDGINGIMGALDRAGERFQFVQSRHEEMAAFMASAFAKFGDEDVPGVCLATSGPGAIHLLNGLYDAKLDHQPVVAIVGQQARMALGGSYQQEVDLVSLYKDVADYLTMVTVPAQLRHAVDRAFRVAMSQRGVTAIIIPNDLQTEDAVTTPPHEHGALLSSVGYRKPRIIPHRDDLEQAAQILNEGERVAILVGAGALHAGDQVLEVADLLGAGVAKALLGKAVVPDDIPYVTGAIGLLGTRPSWEMMQECDTLLMVGSGFPYIEFLPKEGQARAVQIDIDPSMIGIRYPMDVGLVGDSKATLQELIPMLEKKDDRSFQDSLSDSMARWWDVVETRAMAPGRPMVPQRPFWELSNRLPDKAIISADSGSSANWFARDVKLRSGMKASLSGNLATMLPGVPYAVAAKFAHPDRVAVSFVGDGAMQMLGMNELLTACKYYEQWADPRMIICVLHNNDLNQVTWEMRAMEGNPKYEASQQIPDFPYAEFAEMIGLRGIRVEDPDEVGSAWDQLLAADRPGVLEVVTDPSVPPIPPTVTYEQAKNYAERGAEGRSGRLRHHQGVHSGGVGLHVPDPMTKPVISSVQTAAWRIPTEAPESDGTLRWDSTTIIVVEVTGEGATGIGWTYGPAAVYSIVEDVLSEVVIGCDAMSPRSIWRSMLHRLRNAGTPGVASMAVSAVDIAVWDLKARLLEVPLADLLGRLRDSVPVYGSGGFTSYDIPRLQEQLSGWVGDEMAWVKMKVGRDPSQDLSRVIAAARRSATGPACSSTPTVPTDAGGPSRWRMSSTNRE